jgi:hypothetical protein
LIFKRNPPDKRWIEAQPAIVISARNLPAAHFFVGASAFNDGGCPKQDLSDPDQVIWTKVLQTIDAPMGITKAI